MKSRSAIYFERRYCMLIHSLTINQKISVTAFSSNSSEKELIDRTCSFNINQIVYVNCIDVIEDGIKTNDSQAVLRFNLVGDKMFKKSEIATIKFDMNNQKIVKPDSSNFSTKEFSEGRGKLQYKFINLKTKTLNKGEFQMNRDRRTQLEIQQTKDENSFKVDELMKFLLQKDQLISKLEKKIETLISQNKKKKSQSPQRESTKQRAFSLNVRLNPANENTRKENEKLMIKLIQLQQRIGDLEKQVADFDKERDTYERQVAMLKKKNEKLQKLTDSRIKVRGRTSFVGSSRSFIPNADNLYSMDQSNDWISNNQNPTNITVNAPINRPPHLTHQESDISYKTKRTNSQQNKLKARTSMINSSYLPSRYNVEKQQNTPQKSPPPGSMEKIDEANLQKIISIKQDDLKWNSIVIDREEQIDILNRKLQSKTSQAKALQKQLDKCKVQLKKKQSQIKQLKRRSKTNLLLGQFASLKQGNKSRSEVEWLDKIQAQHQSQKVKLEEEIKQLEKQNKDKQKQLKNVKEHLAEVVDRERVIENKYASLKKFTQKKEEEYIEYKEKSQFYDSINTRNKQIEALLKSFQSKCENFERQNKRLSDMSNSLAGKLKEAHHDVDRFKRFEREYQMTKNQNINYVKSIQSYEKQYVSLKRYCIQTEAAYNKYIASKKRGVAKDRITQEDIKEEKQIQQKLIQFSKKMAQAQLMFYSQQIEDLNQEKKYINEYYEKKLREEKDRILQNKEISNYQKKNLMVQKQKETEKIVMSKNEQIRTKMARLERLHEQVKDRMSQKVDVDRPLAEQLRVIQKKISTFQQKEQERIIQRRSLKETLEMLSQQIKKNNSSSYLQAQIQSQTLNKNSSKNELLLSMIQDNNKKKSSLLEQARQRSEASQQRTYEQNRKMNTQLVKQNGQLKMKNQKLAIDIDKIERNRQQREKQLEQTFRKTQLEYKIKIDKYLQEVEDKTKQIETLKTKIADSESAVRKISEEATNLSFEIQAKQIQIQKLEDKIVSYELRIEEYQKSERMMMNKVNQIKKDSQQNKQELFLLIQERSNNFAKIERLKETEIEKLKKIIQELEEKIEVQTFENIKSKEKNEEFKQKVQRLQKETQEKLQNRKMDLQNKQDEYQKLYVKWFNASKQNDILQQNLFQISAQIENKDIQIGTLAYQLTRLNKQVAIYKTQAEKFQQLEIRYKDDVKGLQLLLEDKITQIKHFEDKYRELQMNVEYSAKDLQRLGLSNIRAQSDLKEYQDKYMAKQQEIIKIKQEYSLLEIQRKSQEMQAEKQQKANQALKQQITDLQRQIAKLKEAPVNNSSILRISRKVSQSQAERFDCPSPSRRKPTKRLQVPQSSFIGGGITPISSSQSPHIVTHLSENPFEPRQQIKKTSTGRNEEIKIQIDPPMNSMKQKQNQSNIQISLEESLRTSRKLRQAKKQQIKQEQQMSIQESGGFGHNIELGDSKEEEVEEIIQHYEDQIRDLQRQLNFSNEQNQKLNVELVELSKKVDQLTQLQQQQPNLSLNRTQLGSLGVSKRKLTMQLPANELNEKDNENKLNYSRMDQYINRTSSNIDISRMGSKNMASNNSLIQMQEKYAAAQVEIQYLTNEIQSMKNKLDEHISNNERLIEQAELCRSTMEDLNYSLEEARFQIEQYKNYVQFEQLYLKEKQANAELASQLQELNSELFQKQGEICKLMNEQAQIVEQASLEKTEAVHLNDSKGRLEEKVKQLNQTIHKLKVQYRKYEQSSELQIVRLSETVDDLKLKLKQKNEDLTELGEEYLTLQNEKHDLAAYIQQRQSNSNKKENEHRMIQKRCNELEEQLSQAQQRRQLILKRNKELQNEINQRQQRIKNVSGESGLLVKKYQIKLQSNKQEIQQLLSKIDQKQKIIIVLKNEISLYNDECIQLKQLNEELTYQSTKVEKELKDIMLAYNQQIESLKSVITSQEQQVINYKSIVKQKENENHNLLKNLRVAEKERENYRCESLDMKNSLQKLKNAKNKQNNELNIQIQYKANECERLKAKIEQMSRQIENKGENIDELKGKYQMRLKDYRQKLQRYELLMDEFQHQLKKVEGRPSSQSYEELLFENEMLKNRIDELEEQGRKNNPKDKEQAIYIEFRKYKANKEREIQNLQAEMEEYAIKKNQLQEAIFVLKKENQSLRQENYEANEAKDELNIQCNDLRENLLQVQRQLQFHKKRKLFDMQKLLNDTQ